MIDQFSLSHSSRWSTCKRQYGIFINVSVLTKSPCFVPTSSCFCGLSVGKSQRELGRARNAATTGVIPPKKGILHSLSACQAQNRATIPRKSGEDSHTLRLTGGAATETAP